MNNTPNPATAETITAELGCHSDGLLWTDTVQVTVDDEARATIAKAVELAKENALALGLPDYACRVELRAPNIKGLRVEPRPDEDDTDGLDYANEDSDDYLLVFGDGDIYLRCHPEYDGACFAEYELKGLGR